MLNETFSVIFKYRDFKVEFDTSGFKVFNFSSHWFYFAAVVQCFSLAQLEAESTHDFSLIFTMCWLLLSPALHSFHGRREKEALHFTPYSGKLGSNFLVVVTRYCDAKPIGKLTKMDVSITLPTPAGRHHLPIYVLRSTKKGVISKHCWCLGFDPQPTKKQDE